MISLIEAFEDVRNGVRAYANSRVENFSFRNAIMCSQMHLDLSAWRRVFDGIIQKNEKESFLLSFATSLQSTAFVFCNCGAPICWNRVLP